MPEVTVDSIEIKGVTYYPAGSKQLLPKPQGNYVVVRTYSAGVHVGFLESKDGKEVTLSQTRRIYEWEGAATLSQIAGTGISKPKKCRLPAPIASITLTEAIEIIPCTPEAQEILEGIPEWVA
tara:strand:- start:27 stop:395 length:369 start_codon:yes stop_codon:yes gene_type:complete